MSFGRALPELQLIRDRTVYLGYRLLGCLGLVACLYPVSLGIKYGVIGPQWLRWHLADLLFTIMWGNVFQIIHWHIVRKRYAGTSSMDARIRFLAKMRSWRKSLVAALILALSYEVLSELVFVPLIGPGLLIGGFDLIDVICYVVGFVLGWGFIGYCTMKGLSQIDEDIVQEMKDEDARAERAANTTQQPKLARDGKAWHQALSNVGITPANRSRSRRKPKKKGKKAR